MIEQTLRERLATLAREPKPARWLVGFSGGIDSTVLLHALTRAGPGQDIPVTAVHVNHGLQAGAARWEVHCREVASRLGVELVVRRIAVPVGDPRGTEAAARELRYRAFAEAARPGDYVLTAHHRDDQAETLLLNLLRGSGAAGLAGIGARRALGAGMLLRPLLGVSRAEIEAYAAEHGLAWCDDPSNADASFDRNYLRREILPALERRWPAARAKLAQSAALQGEAAELAGDLARQDLAALGGDPARLHLGALRRLSEARQRNVLRHAIRRLALPPAPRARLTQVVRELVTAAPDSRPRVGWPGAEVRRYRDRVYVQAPAACRPEPASLTITANDEPVALGPGLGRLRLEQAESGGIAPALAAAGLKIAFRRGGETLRPLHRGHTHALKKLFQEQGIVPWRRGLVPLLYAGERLVAVGDLWIAEEAWSAPGFAVRWLDRPRLE
ncbi:MAG TPA: tRNA lysidine(34) synthetase TilS [Woeseiaceae bacterium]